MINTAVLPLSVSCVWRRRTSAGLRMSKVCRKFKRAMAVFGLNRAGSTVGPEGSGVAKLRVHWTGVDSRAGVDRAGMSETVARIRGSSEIAKPDERRPTSVPPRLSHICGITRSISRVDTLRP